MTFKQLIDHYETMCLNLNKSEFVVKYMTMELSQLEPHMFYMNLNEEVDALLLKKIEHAMHQYMNEHIPVDYILGYRYFFGYPFMVNEHVLIPRNETEELVEHVLMFMDNMKKPLKLLDLGTGSGCIGLTSKKEMIDLDVTLADISPEAIEVAKKNADSLHIDVTYIVSNWFSNIDDQYDIIVCNPPYIPEDEAIGDTVDKEPSLALYGGQNGFKHYEEVLSQAPTYLNRDGLMAFEHGYNQKEGIHVLIKKYFKDATILTIKDLQDKERMTFFSPNNASLIKEVSYENRNR
jgi:release factor glutamine methyltransferase